MSRKLHAASLPFVARALRGGRKLRYSAVALLLALPSLMPAAWLPPPPFAPVVLPAEPAVAAYPAPAAE